MASSRGPRSQYSASVADDDTAVVDDVQIRIEGIRFKRVAGPGANGVVFAGTQVLLERPVAVKIWPSRAGRTESQRTTQASSEAQKLGGLNSDKIVRIYDVGFLPNRWVYMVMQYVDGWTLKSVRSELDFIQRGAVWHATSIALREAERLGVYHGDLHEENVIVRFLDATVIDFGSSALAGKRNSLRRHARLVCKFARDLLPELVAYLNMPDIPRLVPLEYASQAVGRWVDTAEALHELQKNLEQLSEEQLILRLRSLAQLHSTTLIDLNTPVIKWLEQHNVAHGAIETYRAAADVQVAELWVRRRRDEKAKAPAQT